MSATATSINDNQLSTMTVYDFPQGPYPTRVRIALAEKNLHSRVRFVLVDLYAGEIAPGRPWTRDTLVNIWSATKGVVATAVAMLVDRGRLAYDAPVARYPSSPARARSQPIPTAPGPNWFQ